MGKPENSLPTRPHAVPVHAQWAPRHPGFEWIAGTFDGEGRRHGKFRSWTRDGLLHGETDYVHGKVHGKNLSFHPDTTIASQAEWIDGLIMDSAFFRSAAPTPEPFAPSAKDVWSVRYYTRDGKTNYTIRYFSRDGTECGPDGAPLPPRPSAVPDAARWFPDMKRWVDGEIERGTSRQVGRWRWWSRDGVQLREEIRDALGEVVMITEHDAAGVVVKRVARTGGGEQRDYYLHDGKLSGRTREDAQAREIYSASWRGDGSLVEEIARAYDGELLTNVTERTAAGLRFEARRDGPALACMLYQADGKTIAASGLMRDGKLSGVWPVYQAKSLRLEVDTTRLAIDHAVTGTGLIGAIGRALYETEEPSFDTPTELAGVDGEPWTSTPGAFGESVTRFPRLLRGLVSRDPLVRTYALDSIAAEIEQEGTTYPATARVLPYLARLLSHSAADRTALLRTIHSAAHAALRAVDHAEVVPASTQARVATRATVEAIADVWPMIYAALATANSEDRRRILTLAKCSPAATADVIAISQRDPDPSTRACAVATLTALDDYDLADATPCLTDRDPLVRAAAAIAIGCTKGASSPREVITALAEGIRNWRDVAQRFAELPYTDGHVLAYLALATGSIRTPDARSLAQALCAALDEVDGRSAITYGQGLLALAFGHGERPFAKRFVEILDTIARSTKFWTFDVNAREMLEAWNLPREQPALAALVRELQAATDPETIAAGRLARA